MKPTQGVIGLLFKLYIAVVFFLTLLVFYLPVNILKQKEQTKKYCFKLFVCWSWLFRIFCFIHVKFMEKAAVPKGPYIIISNHASYLDIFLMYSTLPKHAFLFLGKSEILNYPLMKTFFIKLNIPVFRGTRKAAQSFVEARKAIKKGWSLAIFPEGGIPDENNPKMIPFKDGAFKLAKAMKVPLVPMTFKNNHLLFSDPTHLLGPARPGISKVYLHETITVQMMERLSEAELSEMTFKVIEKPLLKD